MGWIAVIDRGETELEAEVFASFAEVVACAGEGAIISVDMPIGLPSTIGPMGRGPETLIRAKLGQRRSSVFSVPSRAAIFAGPGFHASQTDRLAAHNLASKVARATSSPPRAVSIQAFGLFGKIRELDLCLRSDAVLAERVYESHPEFAFTVLNDGRPMVHSKKMGSRTNGPGMVERRALLMKHGVGQAFLDQPPPKGAGLDDLLDATVLMLVAGRILRSQAVPHPNPPLRDEHGLRLAIWA